MDTEINLLFLIVLMSVMEVFTKLLQSQLCKKYVGKEDYQETVSVSVLKFYIDFHTSDKWKTSSGRGGGFRRKETDRK